MSQFPSLTIIGEEDEHGGNRVLNTTAIFNDRDESILSRECPPELQHITEDQVQSDSISIKLANLDSLFLNMRSCCNIGHCMG